MREDLTEEEMCGSLYFEFFIKKLDSQDARKLTGIIERIHGVGQVVRTSELTRGEIDTFTVTVGASAQYFDAVRRDVIIRAHTFQVRGI